MLNEISQVAQTDATVLITGETGTGKELVARALHVESKRGDKPLIKVNCAAISPALMESEFFGHEKGAFTGATSKHEGRFSLANGGTIFLDEVGELPLDLQSKLLRVLQEGEFDPVGSSRTVSVDVRVICATNRDLSGLTKEGKFREDLFYRLNVFPIDVPPLRDRADDIALLASAFAQRCAKRFGKNLGTLSENTIERLKSYSWPGNIRELHNVLERSFITSSGPELELDHSIPEIQSNKSDGISTPLQSSRGGFLTESDFKKLEHDNLLNALESTNWQIYGDSGAAELLGMNPSTLRSRIKTLGIKRPQ